MADEAVGFGGWSPYRELNPQDQVIFDEALSGLLGVKYTPTLVATQIVKGTNYRYQADAEVPGPTPGTWKALVDIYVPLQDIPGTKVVPLLIQIIKI
ncbi:hypothetical protein PSCICN_12020 [Pseudomonas cichorii]|uniref:hypothetical protein n=1 Tax=Pseudomonas cichorii TaxID=36746 RepID=UPI0019111C95|nr:hypothetical protein [Pseudomonas cichorii]GFM80510.1 hypothetical protein PSCICN_12020 [Pseudomonas cichorii]